MKKKLLKSGVIICFSLFYLFYNINYNIPRFSTIAIYRQSEIYSITYNDNRPVAKNSYINLKDKYELVNTHNKKIRKFGILMEFEDSEYYFLSNGQLKSNEVIITDELARKLKKTKDDNLKIENPFDYSVEEYVIKKIIDVIQIDKNIYDYNVIILGYDDRVKSNLNHFGSVSFNDELQTEDLILSGTTKKYIEIEDVIHLQYFLLILSVLLFSILLILFQYIINFYFENNNHKIIRKKYLYGISKNKIIKSHIVGILQMIILLFFPTIIYSYFKKSYLMIMFNILTVLPINIKSLKSATYKVLRRM